MRNKWRKCKIINASRENAVAPPIINNKVSLNVHGLHNCGTAKKGKSFTFASPQSSFYHFINPITKYSVSQFSAE